MMSEALQFESGWLVRCQHGEMKKPFLGRVLQVIGCRLVVEVMNYHFRDRRAVETNGYKLVVDQADAKAMTIIDCQG